LTDEVHFYLLKRKIAEFEALKTEIEQITEEIARGRL